MSGPAQTGADKAKALIGLFGGRSNRSNAEN
jgi:hypothetical protein